MVVLAERWIRVTEGKVSEEQQWFRKGKSWMDQIFATKMVVQEYTRKGKKLYATFIDLERAYHKIDRQALWNVLKINGVGRILLEGVRNFREDNASGWVEEGLNESFAIGLAASHPGRSTGEATRNQAMHNKVMTKLTCLSIVINIKVK